MELSSIGMGIIFGDYQYYNACVTQHGIIMIFFFIMPITLGAFANYAVPLLIALPDLIMCRLNTFSSLAFFDAGVLLIIQMSMEESCAGG